MHTLKFNKKILLLLLYFLFLSNNSTITASTDRAQYLPGLVSSGAGWSPYITAVGLYSETNDLLAVAKVATPLKKPSDLPLTFKVQIDV